MALAFVHTPENGCGRPVWSKRHTPVFSPGHANPFMPSMTRIEEPSTAALLALQQARAQRQPQAPRFEAFPREEPVTMPGYCPTRGEKARDWQAGELEGCTMLDLYRQGLTVELMLELSVALAMHGESVTRLELARGCPRRRDHHYRFCR